MNTLRIRRLRRAELPADTLTLARYLIGKSWYVKTRGALANRRIAGSHRRNRSLRGWRLERTCVPRSDASQPFALSEARARLRLLHLWLLLLLECFERTARDRRRRSLARCRASRRHRCHGAPSRHAKTCAILPAAQGGSPLLSASTGDTMAWTFALTSHFGLVSRRSPQVPLARACALVLAAKRIACCGSTSAAILS